MLNCCSGHRRGPPLPPTPPLLQPDEEVSDPDFWDARSQTASFCSTSSRFQSVYSSDSRTGSVWSSAGASMQTAATPALAAPEKTLSRLHDLTASIREVIGTWRPRGGRHVAFERQGVCFRRIPQQGLSAHITSRPPSPPMQVAAPLQWSLSAKLPRVQATLPYPGTDDQLVLSFEHVSLQLRVRELLCVTSCTAPWFTWGWQAVELQPGIWRPALPSSSALRLNPTGPGTLHPGWLDAPDLGARGREVGGRRRGRGSTHDGMLLAA